MPTDPATLEIVAGFLRRAKAAVSEGDVAAGTGLDVGTAKRALYDLMRTHRSTIDVREDGTLVYDFGAKLERLDARSWAAWLGAAGRWSWRAFAVVYKASLAVVLVAYSVTFALLIFAAALALSAASESEGPAEAAGHLVWAVFRAIFDFTTITAFSYDDTDRYGYRYAHASPKKPVLTRREPAPPDKGFVASVYDFVLGPPRPTPDARAQHREVASFVRREGGALTVADVQALSGMGRDDAERFFAVFVAEQDGEVHVTESGAMYARFDELLRSASDAHDEPIVHFWDEYEAPHEVTGNTGGKNLTIVFLAFFNLLCAAGIAANPELLGSWSLWLGAIPTAVFSVFFALPLIRAPLVWWRNRARHATNIKKRLFRAIFQSSEPHVTFDDVVESANNAATTEEQLDSAKLRALLEETLQQVGGELDRDEHAKLVMDLQRLRGETQAREENAAEAEVAEVVYSTR